MIQTRMIPETITLPSGQQQTHMRPVQEVIYEPFDTEFFAAAEGSSALEEPLDALSVVLEPRRERLRAAFERKLNLLSAAEMDAALVELDLETRELQAQLRMEKVRQELTELQSQLSETAPAQAARQMLTVPVPSIHMQRTLVSPPIPDFQRNGPFRPATPTPHSSLPTY